MAKYKIAEEIKEPKLTKKDLRAALGVLVDMKDLLMKGWVKGDMKVSLKNLEEHLGNLDPSRRGHKVTKETKHLYCLVGALHEVDGPAEATARRVLTACLIPGAILILGKNRQESDLIDFNDDEDTTHSRVISLVNKAIRKIRKEVA